MFYAVNVLFSEGKTTHMSFNFIIVCIWHHTYF